MGWFSSDKKEEKKKDPKVYKHDRYIGEVLGNVLDVYQNTSYNLKLYMIKDKTSDGGGWMHGSHMALPEETVVIAQTAVTGVQIDNLDIEFVQGPNTGNSVATRVSFDLYQPGAADLLDQIQMTKHYLGHYMYADVPMFLAIEFKGYEDDIDDIDAGGEPVTIAGPYIYQLKIAKVAIAIDDTGSTYQFECPVGSSEAFADFHFKLPKDMYVQGRTIEALTENLQENIKKFKEDNLKDEDVHDIIEFDLSQILSVLDDTSLMAGSNRGNRKNAEQINRLINAESKGIKTKEDFEKALEDNPDSLDGGVTVESSGFGTQQQINMKEGTSINQFFTTLFVMCDDFLNKISRKKNFRSPNVTSAELDLEKTFTHWYVIEAEIEYLEFDEFRNKYAQKITYKPILKKTRNPKASLSSGEEDLTEQQVEHHIRNLHIKKAYHYLYTGLNDQVLSADIQYNAGQVLLAPPGSGKMGDLSTSPNSGAANIDDTHDITGTTQENEKLAEEFNKKLKKDTGLRAKLQRDLGYDDKAMTEFLKDEQRVAQTSRAVSFTNYGNPTGNQTSGGSGTQADEGNYKPEASGYIYSGDLMSDLGGSETMIGEVQKKHNQRNAVASIREAAKEGDIEPRMSRASGSSIVSTSGDTSDGTNAATLFGYMYNNVNDSSILIDLGLKVRGDPYFLGTPMSYDEARKPKKKMTALEEYQDSSTKEDEGMSYNASDDTFFLFTMQTPRVRDPDIDEEDNNSGYMTQAGTAFFISGIYQIVSTTCNFSSGMFTVDFTKAPKETSLPLSKFKLTGDGVDYGDDDFNPAAEADAYNAEQTRREAERRAEAQGGGND